MYKLTVQIALVTGGANEIGRGIVEMLAKASAKVMIYYIDEAAGEKVAEEVNSDFYY